MSAVSQFIVSIYQYDNNDQKWSYLEDGFAIISDRTFGPTLMIRSKENINHENNVNYMDVIISDNLNVEYKESENNSGYTVRFDQSNTKIGIKFDQASSQAYEEFKSELEKKIATRYKTIYYESGNLQYSGQFVDNDVSGEGTEFYDTPEQKVKFHGELENNMYDGSGVFYSCDGSLELQANNISRGIPNGNVTLIIHRKNKDDLKKSFNYRSIDLALNVGDVNFCENIARHFYPNLDNLFFEAYSIEEKMDEINRKLDFLLNDRTKEIMEMERANRGYLQKLVGVFWNV
jgi:hypothetical protein